VLSCEPTPCLEYQTNSLTYLCVTGSASQRRRRLVLISLLLSLLQDLLQDLHFILILTLTLIFPILLLLLLIIIIIIPFDAGAVEK
jgi:hypothetical protein